MVAESIQRRLAAILAIDVAGYSRLMGEDEEGTLRALTAHRRELIDPNIAEQNGRIVKTTGDGALVEFASAVDAVRCAVEIQRGMAARNADLPSDKRVDFRAGINVGDIIIQADDIFGDGVNIAARLEGIAEPGGICVSRTVYEQIGTRLDISFTDLGEQKLKNIAQAVRAFRVDLSDGPASSQPRAKLAIQYGPARGSKAAFSRYASIGLILAGVLAGIGWYWQSSRVAGVGPSVAAMSAAERAALSIVVLPFANGTGDPQQAYIVDGITASITSDLSRVRDAFVVAAATAFPYKDKPVNLQQLGADLGVRFVLQGSVQRVGTTIRINAQLADTRTSAQLWTENFQGDQANLFALQDQVTARVGNSIGREMVMVAARESDARVSNAQAADFILRARAAEYRPQSLENLGQIEDWYRQALKLDPDNVTAMVGLARALTVSAFNFGNWLAPDVREKKYAEGRDYALKAKELDPSAPHTYGILALYALTHGDYPGHQRASETWLSLDPKNPIAYNFVANSLMYRVKPQEAIALLDQATALDTKPPSALIVISYARAYFMHGNNDAAIDWSQRTLDLNPRFTEAYVYLAMAYKLKGNDAKSSEAVASLLQKDPQFKAGSLKEPTSTYPPAYKAFFKEKYLPAARKAGLPE